MKKKRRKRSKRDDKWLDLLPPICRLLGDDYDPGALPTDKYFPGMPEQICKALGVRPYLVGY